MPLQSAVRAILTFRRHLGRFAAGAGLALVLAAALPLGMTAAFSAPKTAPAVKKGSFASYRAIYDITLENMAEKSDITGLNGRMAYEFSGSKCEGWTTQFRLLTHVDMKDDASRLTDRQSTSFEAADGKEFRFATKNYLDGDLTEEVVGTARRGKNGLEVVLTKPEGETYKLKKADFPLMQMAAIIQAAQAGRRFIKMELFDGSGMGDSVAETTIIIGNKQKPAADDREIKFMGDFADEPAWPVTVAYFDDAENEDGLPGYRTEFLLYENGITRNLFMDYGDFSIRGKLVRLDILQEKSGAAACKK